MSRPPAPATASAPASSANLGPGFDCLALALELRCRVRAEPASSWSVEHGGEHRPQVDDEDGVLAAAQRAVGKERPLRLLVSNAIPLGRGLGSSAAAYAAAAAAAIAAVGDDFHPERIFRLVCAMEGHPDNAAAAVFGGLELVLPDGLPYRLPWHPELTVVVAVPPDGLPTRQARTVVPPAVDTPVVVRSLSRLASLTAGLLTADPTLLAAAAGDELHETPRGALRPQVAELLHVARSAGALHAAWSGAGPSVLAVVTLQAIDQVRAALASHLPVGGEVLTPSVATEGLRMLPPD